MDNSFNEKLVSSIKRHISTRSLISTLTDILPLGQEAIYRRLRGDVPFTLAEAALISAKLDISLDELVGKIINPKKTKWALLDISMLFSLDDFHEQYLKKINTFTSLFIDMQQAKKASMRSAVNIIPLVFLLEQETLIRFIAYKWYFLTQGVNPTFLFSEMEIQPNAVKATQNLLKEIHQIPKTFILDRNMFSYLINDILYFYDRKLISNGELHQIKIELGNLITSMEHVAEKGISDSGSEIMMYLSDVRIDANYIHFEYDNLFHSFQLLYYIDFFDFNNATICQQQREWIELLKRYSVQITQSGEVQRYEFFRAQRKLVEELGKYLIHENEPHLDIILKSI